MARVCMMMVLFSSFFMSGMTFDMQLVKVYPKQAVLGVFEASIGNKYALNASASRDLCEHLGLRIASKAQVAEAQKHGLETCRFGWIDEQIAVVPRVQVKSNCGNGKTGVVVWRANPSAQFDVFCFNLTDFEAQASIKAHQRTTRKPMMTLSAIVPTAGVHLRGSLSPKISSLSSSVPPHSVSVVHKGDDGEHLAVSSGPTEAVPAALLITVTFAVMLAVFLALYYFKTNRPCRAQCDVEQQKEYIETEVWEHCGKKDLQKTQEEQAEENNEEEQLEENEEEQVEYNNEKQVKNNNEEQVEDNDEEQVEDNDEKQVGENNEEEQVKLNEQEQVEENEEEQVEENEEEQVEYNNEKQVKNNNEEQVEDNDEKQVEENNEEEQVKLNEQEQVEENEEEQVEVNDEEEQMEENEKESSSAVEH